MARAMEIPLYRIFYDGEEPPKVAKLQQHPVADGAAWGSSGKHAGYFKKLHRLLARMNEKDRKLLLYTVQRMAGPRAREAGQNA